MKQREYTASDTWYILWSDNTGQPYRTVANITEMMNVKCSKHLKNLVVINTVNIHGGDQPMIQTHSEDLLQLTCSVMDTFFKWCYEPI